MRVDWLPYSAASLVAGAGALAVSLVLVPTTDGALPAYDVAADGRWLVVAYLVLLASVALVLGLPAALTLADGRGRRPVLAGAGLVTVGCLAMAGHAMALVVARAFVVDGAVGAAAYDAALASRSVGFFSSGGAVAFLAGVLLIGLGVLRARSVPRWLVLLLVAAVVLLPLGALVAEPLVVAGGLALTVALAGLGIHANQRFAVPLT